MIQIIIFSFNRALQLDTLLRSLVMHWKSPDYCVDIIYNSSDDFFQNGYDILIGKYGIYWSSTVYNDTTRHIMTAIDDGRISLDQTPSNNYRNLLGAYVRCVKRLN